MAKKLYDPINKKFVETTPIPGEKAVESTNVSAPRPTLNQNTNDLINYTFNQEPTSRTVDTDDVSQYDEGMPLDVDSNEWRAERQGFWDSLANATVGGAVSGLGTAAEDLGYIFDLSNTYDRLTGGQISGDNWLSNIGKVTKDWADETMPIYEKDLGDNANLGDHFFRWSTWKSALDSMVGYGLAGGVVGGGVRAAMGTGMRMSLGLETLAKQSPQLTAFAANSSSALLTNFGEGKTMALEVYEQQMDRYKPLIDNGTITENEAISQASEAADKFQMWNMMFMASDYIGFKHLFNASLAPSMGKKAIELGKIGVREYGEEVGQKITQENVSEGQFKSAEKDLGIASPFISNFNKANAPANAIDLYEQQLNDFYKSKSGEEYLDKARKKHGANTPEFWRDIEDNFVAHANVLSNSPDDLIQRSIETFLKPETQVEGLIGMFSGPGQWAVTKGIGFRNELKKEKEEYQKQQDFVNNSKEILSNNLKGLETMLHLNEQVAKSTLSKDAATDEQTTPVTVEEVNLDGAWSKMMLTSIENNTDSQLENILKEKIDGDNNEESVKAKELLNELNEVRSIVGNSKNYYNAFGSEIGDEDFKSGVIHDKLTLRNLKNLKRAIDTDDNVSDDVKNANDNQISILEKQIKQKTSFGTQKELLRNHKKLEDQYKNFKSAIESNDLKFLNRLVNDESYPKNLRQNAARFIEKQSVGEATPPTSNTKTKQTSHSKQKGDDKPVSSDKIKITQDKLGKPFDDLNSEISALTKSLNTKKKVKSKSPKLEKQIVDDQEKLDGLTNKRKHTIDVANELKGLSDKDFNDVFESTLQSRIDGKTTAKNTEQSEEEKEKVNNAVDKGLGDNAKKVVKEGKDKPLDEVIKNDDPVDVKVSQNNATPSEGTITRSKNKKGDIYFKLNVKGKSKILSNKELKKGIISTLADGTVAYSYKLDNGQEVVVTDTQVVSDLSKLLNAAIDSDNKSDNDSTKDTDKVFISEEDKKTLRIENEKYLNTGVLTIELAEVLNRNRSAVNLDGMLSLALGELDGSNEKLSSNFGLEVLQKTGIAQDLIDKYSNYIDSLSDDSLESFKIILSSKALNSTIAAVASKFGEKVATSEALTDSDLLQSELEYSVIDFGENVEDRKEAVEDILEAIDDYHDGAVKTISDIVEVLKDNVSDEALLGISNNFNSFSTLVSEVKFDIIKDAATFEDAAGFKDDLGANEIQETVTDDAIKTLEDETNIEIDRIKESDPTLGINSNTRVMYTNRKLPNGFNKIAYLARNYFKKLFYNEDSNVVTMNYEDVEDSIMWSDSMSLSTKVGDKIQLTVDSEYDGPMEYEGKSYTWPEFKEKFKDEPNIVTENTPIVIKKGDSQLGYLHVPDWMRSEKISGDIDLNKERVTAIRNYIIKNGSLDTTISKKGNGVLFKLKEYVSVASMSGDNLKLAVMTYDGLKNGLITVPTNAKTKIGYTYAIVPLTSTYSAVIPVTNRFLVEQQIRTIEEAIRIYNDKIDNMLYHTAKVHSKQDLTTQKGLSKFLEKYLRIYRGEKGMSAAVLDNRIKKLFNQSLRASKPFFAFDSKGKFIGSEFLRSDSINTRMQVDALKLDNKKFNAYEIADDGSIVDANDGRSYSQFVKDNTLANFTGIKNIKENGEVEWAYSYQNTVIFDTKQVFDDDKGTKGKTKTTNPINPEGATSTRSDETAETSEKIRTPKEKRLELVEEGRKKALSEVEFVEDVDSDAYETYWISPDMPRFLMKQELRTTKNDGTYYMAGQRFDSEEEAIAFVNEFYDSQLDLVYKNNGPELKQNTARDIKNKSQSKLEQFKAKQQELSKREGVDVIANKSSDYLISNNLEEIGEELKKHCKK